MKTLIIIVLFTGLIGSAVADASLFAIPGQMHSTSFMKDEVMREWAVEWLKIELRNLTEADRAEIRARRTP